MVELVQQAHYLRRSADVAFAPMEDLSIEDLIADVVANPTPIRVSPQPATAAPTAAPAPAGTVVGKIVRRITARR